MRVYTVTDTRLPFNRRQFTRKHNIQTQLIAPFNYDHDLTTSLVHKPILNILKMYLRTKNEHISIMLHI